MKPLRGLLLFCSLEGEWTMVFKLSLIRFAAWPVLYLYRSHL